MNHSERREKFHRAIRKQKIQDIFSSHRKQYTSAILLYDKSASEKTLSELISLFGLRGQESVIREKLELLLSYLQYCETFPAAVTSLLDWLID